MSTAYLIKGVTLGRSRIDAAMKHPLMLVTASAPAIRYDKLAEMIHRHTPMAAACGKPA